MDLIFKILFIQPNLIKNTFFIMSKGLEFNKLKNKSINYSINNI